MLSAAFHNALFITMNKGTWDKGKFGDKEMVDAS